MRQGGRGGSPPPVFCFYLTAYSLKSKAYSLHSFSVSFVPLRRTFSRAAGKPLEKCVVGIELAQLAQKQLHRLDG